MDILNYLLGVSLSDYGSWASIIGVVVSLFTFGAVFFLRKTFLFRSRVDEHAKILADLSSKIVGCLNSFETNKDRVDELVGLAEVAIRSAKKGSSGALKSYLSTAHRQAKLYKYREFIGFRFSPKSKHARNVAKSINIAVAEIQNVKKELMVGK
ncbi:conserved hypothetical protein [Vibrio chagasii]|nr:conserved hypothetical protein [Vibrio chagasii]CAH6945188.1 conserved hypothetical protein [Vibrio chagasii]CAH6957697.1 conserved hypothetical protein [Vibrio chagasii]CAH7179270.1 conserved hypothetical protein [Vibrio chagasii]